MHRRYQKAGMKERRRASDDIQYEINVEVVTFIVCCFDILFLYNIRLIKLSAPTNAEQRSFNRRL